MNDEIPAELFEVLPIEEALRVLRFDEISRFGDPQRNWGPIEVVACPWPPIPCLIVMIKIKSVDRIYWPQECGIAYNMKPIEILSIIYKACGSLFRHEEPPKELNWGKLDLERRREEFRQEEERRPRLWAEREFFRFCLNYIALYNDWSEEDFDVEFTYSDGQLKIKVRNMEVFCPARGTFYGTLTFSARHLYRNMPKRFIDTAVQIIVFENDAVSIGSAGFHAKWVENQIQPNPAEIHGNIISISKVALSGTHEPLKSDFVSKFMIADGKPVPRNSPTEKSLMERELEAMSSGDFAALIQEVMVERGDLEDTTSHEQILTKDRIDADKIGSRQEVDGLDEEMKGIATAFGVTLDKMQP